MMLVDRISRRNTFFILLLVTLLLNFICLITNKLSLGARWSSGLLLGGIDNWLEGGNMYTIMDDGITPGSSYNPGNLFLALVLRRLFGFYAESFLIIIAGLILLLLLWGFSILLSEKREEKVASFTIMSIIFLIDFSFSHHYVPEFHPDIPAVTFFLWGAISIDRYLNNKSLLLLCCIVLLFMISGLLKQNAAFLFIGLGVFVLFSKSITIHDKIIILLAEFLSGLGVLVTMLLIKGCWFNCVVVNSLHPLMGVREYFRFLVSTGVYNIHFILLCAYYFLLLYQDKIKTSLIEKMWLICSISWFLFCMYASAKVGANQGNMEAAIIVFMPFSLRGAVMLYYNVLQKLINAKILRYGYLFFIGAFLILSLKSAFSIADNCLNYSRRLSNQKEFSKWISNNYPNKKIAYNTLIYEIFNNAQICKRTDLYTVAVFCMGNILDDKKLSIMSEDWDLIITHSALSENKWPQTFEHFKKIDENLYPACKVPGGKIEVYSRK